jgi:hypothetical protein
MRDRRPATRGRDKNIFSLSISPSSGVVSVLQTIRRSTAMPELQIIGAPQSNYV